MTQAVSLIDLTSGVVTDVSTLGPGRTVILVGETPTLELVIEVTNNSGGSTFVQVGEVFDTQRAIAPLPSTEASQYMRARVTNGTLGAAKVYVTGPLVEPVQIDLTTSLQDVSSIGEGRMVYVRGGSNVAIAIEEGESAIATQFREIGRIMLNRSEERALSLPTNTSNFLRYRVAQGSSPTAFSVWVAGPPTGGGSGGQSEALAFLTIAALEAAPGPVEVSSAEVQEVQASYLWQPGGTGTVDHIKILGATGGQAGRWFLQGDRVTLNGTDDVALQAKVNLLAGTGIALVLKKDTTITTPVTSKSDLTIFVEEGTQIIGNITGTTADKALFYYTTNGLATGSTTVAATVATTLNGGITATAEVIAITSGAGFPTANFWAQVDSEIIYVLARSGTTCYVQRGADGSVAATHSNLAAFSQIPSVFSNTLTVASATGIAINTWISIFSAAYGVRGGYYQVTGVSGAVLTLDRPILWSFLVADSVSIYGAGDPMISNFSIVGYGGGGIFTGKCAIYVNLVGSRDCLIENMRGQKNANLCSDAGLAYQTGHRNDWIRCTIDGTGGNAPDKLFAPIGQEGLTIVNSNGHHATGWGIGINDCVDCYIADSTLQLCSYGVHMSTETVATAGIYANRWIHFDGVRSTESTLDGFALFVGTSDCDFEKCIGSGNGNMGVNAINGGSGNTRQQRNTFVACEFENNVAGGVVFGDGTYDSSDNALVKCNVRRNTGHGVLVAAASLGTLIQGGNIEDNDNATQTASDIRILGGDTRVLGVRMNTGCSSGLGVIGIASTIDVEIDDLVMTHRAGSFQAVGLIRTTANSPRVKISNSVLTAAHANDICVWGNTTSDIRCTNVLTQVGSAAAGTTGFLVNAAGTLTTDPNTTSTCATALSASGGGTITYINGIYFALDVALTGGTAVLASGKDLTFATLIGVFLKTPTTATGIVTATFVAGANGNVTVTSYTLAAAQTATDASTYTVVFTGAQ